MALENMSIIFSSGITSLVEQNSSFDKGLLRVAYVGDNRNGSSISKETFERCINTIYNCPVVCRYDREADTIGSHDVDIVRKDDGLHLVNATHPVGVVPAGAEYHWETIEEADGSEHEYLCVEVLLWKRQEAYQKIKDDGVVDESMEITVKEGELVNGIFVIKDFEFTAFCLLGTAEPCYESASLAVFSDDQFKAQFATMMQELKESISQVNPSLEANINTHTEDYSEGGIKVLEDKLALLAEFGLSADALDFNLDDFTIDELREKFEAIKAEQEQAAFALAQQVTDAIVSALGVEEIDTDWGTMRRYCYVDHDPEASEVYCYDAGDKWNLYGFTYSMNGDNAVIDFESKKRKKFSIVDFDMGEQPSPVLSMFEIMSNRISETSAQWEAKYQTAADTITSLNGELNELKEFKNQIEASQAKADRDAVFAQFEDLVGVDAFENLRQSCEDGSVDFSIEELEDKCYSIRGRQGIVAKFSNEAKPVTPRLKVTRDERTDEPYGGIFKKYGY